MGKENAAVVFGGRIAIGIGLQRAFFIADMGEDALFYHKVPVSRRRRFAEDMCIRKKGVVEEEIAAEAARLAMHHLQRLGPLEVQCRDGFLLERSDRIEKGGKRRFVGKDRRKPPPQAAPRSAPPPPP